ncbi:unnamed protein product, partial [Polarella glacialis]
VVSASFAAACTASIAVIQSNALLPFATCCKPLLLRELRSPADAASHLPPSGLTARHADEQDEQAGLRWLPWLSAPWAGPASLTVVKARFSIHLILTWKPSLNAWVISISREVFGRVSHVIVSHAGAASYGIRVYDQALHSSSALRLTLPRHVTPCLLYTSGFPQEHLSCALADPCLATAFSDIGRSSKPKSRPEKSLPPIVSPKSFSAGSTQSGVEATELGAAAARLGLGADRPGLGDAKGQLVDFCKRERARESRVLSVEDATSWELSFFARTLNSVRDRCPREAQLLFHYTDLPSAEAIVAGHRGLRLSRGGYRGGGVFFSRLSPLEDQNMGRDPALLWRSAFPRFQAKQLQRNYGSDIVGRNTKVDAVLLCVVPSSMIEDLPDRKDAAFIPLAHPADRYVPILLERLGTCPSQFFGLCVSRRFSHIRRVPGCQERFETFGAEYFAYRNIPRAYRLAPQEAWLQGRRSRVQSSYEAMAADLR